MKKVLHILIFLFITNCVLAADVQSKSDSLIALLQEMPEDTNRVKVLNELSSDNMFYYHDQKLTFIKQALILSQKLNYIKGELISLERMAHYYYNVSKYDSSLYYLKMAEKLAKNAIDKTYLTELYENYSLVYLSLAEYYKAIEIGYLALELAIEVNTGIAKGNALARLGIIYLKINNYEKSIEFTEQALTFHTRLNNSFLIDADHYYLGKAYTKLKNKEKAIFHYQIILEKNDVNEDIDLSGNRTYIEGQVLTLKGNFNAAMDKYVEAIELMRKVSTNKMISEVLLNITELWVEMLQNDHSTVFAEESIIKMGYKNFDDFARSSYMTMELSKENDIMVSTLQCLMEYYKLKQNAKEAYKYGNEYIYLKDSLFKLDNAKVIAEQQVYFELKQNEKQIELLNLQNRANEEEIEARQQQQYAYLGSAALLLIVILALRNRIKIIRQGRDLIKAKNDILEKERIKSNQSEKFKEEFLANVSHEIRTPMNAIMGITNILLKNKHTEEQISYLEAMNHSAKNLLVLVNDILDFSKLEAGKMKVLSLPFNPREILNNVYGPLKINADEKEINLKFSVDENVPQTLIGDSKMLQQILFNLVRNGISFTEQGGVELKCSLSGEKCCEGVISYVVKDTGIGIVVEKQDKVLETFVKVYDKKALNYGGSGLELAIIKQMVELQGGNIRLESTPSEGTTFYLEIPYKLMFGEEYINKKADENDTLLDLSGISILLVEDNEFNVMVAQEELNSSIEEAKIDIAVNGKMAVKKIIENNYDVILMDVQMPEMNGYDATKIIRKLQNSKAKTPIIAMTANNMQQEIDNCYKAGMNEYISKPFDTLELLGKIRKLTVNNSIP